MHEMNKQEQQLNSRLQICGRDVVYVSEFCRLLHRIVNMDNHNRHVLLD